MAALHTALVALHAVTATLAFAAGAALLRPRPLTRSWARRVYLPSLAVMTASLALAVVVGWPGFATGERLAFPALLVLAAAMVVLGARAASAAARRGDGEVDRLYDAGGFTLISLFDGFVVVAAIDLGAPGWVVALVAVAGVLLGRRLVHTARARALVLAPAEAGSLRGSGGEGDLDPRPTAPSGKSAAESPSSGALSGKSADARRPTAPTTPRRAPAAG